jgi:hypothetical protein
MKEYRKTATVKAKLFEKGDEDGFIHPDVILEEIENIEIKVIKEIPFNLVPYISTLENQFHKGEFGKHYLCIGVKGEKWLVEKSIFEETYQEV